MYAKFFEQFLSLKPVSGNNVDVTKKLLKESITIARNSGISKNNLVVDPAIGFFRSNGTGKFFTKIKSDWVKRDLELIQNIKKTKQGYPTLISVSNKSFLGRLLDKKPDQRLSGSLASFCKKFASSVASKKSNGRIYYQIIF